MDRRTYLLAIGALGVSSLAGCSEESRPSYDISITLPAEVEVGDEVTLSWAVENTGDATGEGTVRVRSEADGEEAVLDEREVAIAAGETVDGSMTDTLGEPGEVTVYVEAPDGSSASSTLRVVEGTDEEVAEEYLRTAHGELDAATELLLEAVEQDDVDLDTRAFESNLDAAESALEEAEPEATEEQLAILEDLRGYAEFLSLWADSHGTGEEAFGEHLLTGNDEYWTARDYYFTEPVEPEDLEASVSAFQESAGTFQEGHDGFQDALATAEDAKTVLEEISPDVVDSFEAVGYDRCVEEIDEQVWILSQFVPFAAGLHQGAGAWVEVSAAFYQIVAAENWEEAITHFETAGGQFETSVSTLEEFPFDELTFVVTFFGPMLCEIGEGPAAAEHWLEGARAGQGGDTGPFEESVQAGRDLMAQCHEE